MAEHAATVEWRRNDVNFVDHRYSRSHTWSFDGGIEVSASSSPHVVPVPMSELSAVDPEEAFVASLSSCHMLWFLSIAAKRGFVVEKYRDVALGVMSKTTDGKMAITSVTLSPDVEFSGKTRPSMTESEAMHLAAHESCYIANSVKSEIRCNPTMTQRL